MPERHTFEYAVVRVVPHIAREEFINVGVVLFSRTAEFLGCRIALDGDRLRSLAGDDGLDLPAVTAHLQALRDICEGNASSGPIGALSPPERFHWLVAPRSTAIQISAVHSGVCDDPPAALQHLFQSLVAR